MQEEVREEPPLLSVVQSLADREEAVIAELGRYNRSTVPFSAFAKQLPCFLCAPECHRCCSQSRRCWVDDRSVALFVFFATATGTRLIASDLGHVVCKIPAADRFACYASLRT